VRQNCNKLWSAATIAVVPDTQPVFQQRLHPHHAAPGPVGLGVHVMGAWSAMEALELCFTLDGPAETLLRIPVSVTPSAADGLWQHTCFEMFVAGSSQNRYHEYNFSPSGQWARYRFAAERVRDGSAEDLAGDRVIPIDCRVDAGGLTLRASIPLADLPHGPQGWLVGLSAVLEHADGQLSHWALHHPREQADFHHPAGRILRLPPYVTSPVI
jgi:hypothetical protein